MLGRLIFRSIRFHWRAHLGLFSGVCITCAVLTGSLIVGDSVRGTLATIAMLRLGNTGFVMDWGKRFFDAQLAEKITEYLPKSPENWQQEKNGESSDTSKITQKGRVAAALYLDAVAETVPKPNELPRRLNTAILYGIDSNFFDLTSTKSPVPAPLPQQAYVNKHAATRLGLSGGEEIILRLIRPSQFPAEAPLSGAHGDTTAVARVQISSILEDDQGGRFTLKTDQVPPYAIFVDRSWLGELIYLNNKANLLLTNKDEDLSSLNTALKNAWAPELIGLTFRTVSSNVLQLESERFYLEDAIVEVAVNRASGYPVLTYFLNHIRSGTKTASYSFAVAGSAPLDTPPGSICINQWLADELEVDVGDTLHISWWKPMVSGGFEEEFSEATVSRILPMEALSLERALAPYFPGLSDVNSCKDWDIGLPLNEEDLLNASNEQYWKIFGQTPKLLTTFETGRAWWGNHFGSVTAVRFNPQNLDVDSLSEIITKEADIVLLGLTFRAIRQVAQEAAAQSIDFGMLFLGMSMFIIAASLILLALLFTFNIQQRTNEIGVLSVTGWSNTRIRVRLLLEIIPAVFFGSVAGVLAGTFYAAMLLKGLAFIWPSAVSGTPIGFFYKWSSLIISPLTSVVVAIVTLFMGIWRAVKRPIMELLHRDFSVVKVVASGHKYMGTWGLFLSFLLVVFFGWHGFNPKTTNPSLWFFLSSTMLLITGLLGYTIFLRKFIHRLSFKELTLHKLAITNLARRRSRSVGLATITAAGTFILISVFSMQFANVPDTSKRQSGTGGFSVIVTSALPIPAEGGLFFGLPKDQVMPLRVWDGDDAGCLNLNRAKTPRIYGIDPDLPIKKSAFTVPDNAQSLWSLLDLPNDDTIYPVLVGDSDTALWGLQAILDKESGTILEYVDNHGKNIALRTVGSLPMRVSLFQGALLLSEKNFVTLFPYEKGHRAFLIESDDPENLCDFLNRNYGKYGVDAVPSGERLEQFLAVEHAYLSMFALLGAIGLLLGAGGVTVVVFRSLIERRPEIALLLSLGYQQPLVLRLLAIEHAYLLLIGFVIGVFAALAGILPILLRSYAQPDFIFLVLLMLLIAATHLLSVWGMIRLFVSQLSFSVLSMEQ